MATPVSATVTFGSNCAPLGCGGFWTVSYTDGIKGTTLSGITINLFNGAFFDTDAFALPAGVSSPVANGATTAALSFAPPVADGGSVGFPLDIDPPVGTDITPSELVSTYNATISSAVVTNLPLFETFTPNASSFAFALDGGGNTATATLSGDVSGEAPIPEPSTMLLVGAGLVALGFIRRRQTRTE